MQVKFPYADVSKWNGSSGRRLPASWSPRGSLRMSKGALLSMGWRVPLGIGVALLGALGIATALSPQVRGDLQWALWSMVHQPSDDAGWQQD